MFVYKGVKNLVLVRGEDETGTELILFPVAYLDMMDIPTRKVIIPK